MFTPNATGSLSTTIRKLKASVSYPPRCSSSGAIPADKPIRQIWEVVAAKLPARKNASEKILVATVGLTTQDTAIAHALFMKAKAEGRGIRLPF